MSWDITDKCVNNLLILEIEMENGYQIYYSKKQDINVVTSYFKVDRRLFIDGRNRYKDDELIMVCLATYTGGDTDTHFQIPVNSICNSSNLDENMWILLLVEKNGQAEYPKVKRTSNKVSDAKPLHLLFGKK